jgi:hypothetical protein
MVDLLYKKLIEVNKGNKIAVGNCELIKKNYVNNPQSPKYFF